MTLHHVLPLALAAVANPDSHRAASPGEVRQTPNTSPQTHTDRRGVRDRTDRDSAVRPFAGTDARLMFDGGHVITQLDDLSDECSLLIGEDRLIYHIGVGDTFEVRIPATLRSS